MAPGNLVEYFYSPGGPLMNFNPSSKAFTIIGTLYGGGYNCKTDHVEQFEGYSVGVWNKVSSHMDWIRETVEEFGEKACKDNK